MCHLNSKVKLHFLTATDAIWKACNVIKQICNKAKNQATGNYSSHQENVLKSVVYKLIIHICVISISPSQDIFLAKKKDLYELFSGSRYFLALKMGFICEWSYEAKPPLSTPPAHVIGSQSQKCGNPFFIWVLKTQKFN